MSENVYIKILAFVLCYIIGSFPTAYLLVKKKHNKDITKEGSGNVGTFNAVHVTKSKSIGIIVLLIDLLKGIVPVYLMLFVFGLNYKIAVSASTFLILGHNYPVWLKFNGGRGLAPGAGIYLILNYYVLIGWCITWLVLYLIKKDVLAANAIATLGIFISIFLINKYSMFVLSYNISGFSLLYFTISSVVITFIVLSRHIEVFKNLFNKKSI